MSFSVLLQRNIGHITLFDTLFVSFEPMGVSYRVFHAGSKYVFKSCVLRTGYEKNIYNYVACTYLSCVCMPYIYISFSQKLYVIQNFSKHIRYQREKLYRKHPFARLHPGTVKDSERAVGR